MCLQRFRFIVLKHKAWKRKKNSRHIYLVCRKMCVNVKCRVCVLVLYSVQVKFTEITFLSYTFNLEFLEIDWRTPETNQKNKKYTTIVDSLIATYAVEHIHYLVNEVKSEAQEMFDRHSLSESEREHTLPHEIEYKQTCPNSIRHPKHECTLSKCGKGAPNTTLFNQTPDSMQTLNFFFFKFLWIELNWNVWIFRHFIARSQHFTDY